MKCVAHICTWSKRSANASDKRYHSIQNAVCDLLAHHPYGVPRDGSGRTVTIDTPDAGYSAKDGVLAVVWKGEGDAVAKDLVKALAVIRAS